MRMFLSELRWRISISVTHRLCTQFNQSHDGCHVAHHCRVVERRVAVFARFAQRSAGHDKYLDCIRVTPFRDDVKRGLAIAALRRN
jgi:hypothetical protein